MWAALRDLSDVYFYRPIKERILEVSSAWVWHVVGRPMYTCIVFTGFDCCSLCSLYCWLHIQLLSKVNVNEIDVKITNSVALSYVADYWLNRNVNCCCYARRYTIWLFTGLRYANVVVYINDELTFEITRLLAKLWISTHFSPYNNLYELFTI